MTQATSPPTRNVNPQTLLNAMLIPALVLPLNGWMFSVALPLMRDTFAVQADTAAWFNTAFALPFVVLMPLIGRLSDSLGKRRLLLYGLLAFVVGALIVMSAVNLPLLFLGRAIQGAGMAGHATLIIALISEVFPASERGQALGVFSVMGPITGAIAPLLAGGVITYWGWRASFLVPMLVGIVSFFVIQRYVPRLGRQLDKGFLRSFDWTGALLLTVAVTLSIFYLSSRPITGVDPLRDWRLLIGAVLFLTVFVFYERLRPEPFLDLSIFRNRSFTLGSLAAGLRMVALSGGIGFLMPLYLADVFAFDANRIGLFLMILPASMALFTRFGGRMADKYGSRNISLIGFSLAVAFMLALRQLTGTSPLWQLVGLLVVNGLGLGLMLAALHRAALRDMPESELGTASGLYGMIRFLGSTFGGAVGGVILRGYQVQFPADVTLAYQSTFLWFAAFGAAGVVVGFLMHRGA